jgi:hypothetical protein
MLISNSDKKISPAYRVEVKNPVLPHGASSIEKAIQLGGYLRLNPHGHSSPLFRAGHSGFFT